MLKEEIIIGLAYGSSYIIKTYIITTYIIIGLAFTCKEQKIVMIYILRIKHHIEDIHMIHMVCVYITNV